LLLLSRYSFCHGACRAAGVLKNRILQRNVR